MSIRKWYTLLSDRDPFHPLRPAQCADVQKTLHQQDQQHQQITVKKGSGSQTIPSPFREAEISQLYKKDHPTYRALLEKRQTLEQERKRLNKRVSAMPSTQQEVLHFPRTRFSP